MLGNLSGLASIEDSRGSIQRSASKAGMAGANVRRLIMARHRRMSGFMAMFQQRIVNGFWKNFNSKVLRMIPKI